MNTTFADQAFGFRSTSPLRSEVRTVATNSISLTPVTPSDLSTALMPPAFKQRLFEASHVSDRELAEEETLSGSSTPGLSPVEKMFTPTFTIQSVNNGGDFRHLCCPNSVVRAHNEQLESTDMFSIASPTASRCLTRGASL